MAEETISFCKGTVSLSDRLVSFTDREAARLELSRSVPIARILAKRKAAYEANLAGEGYRFYAHEASEFAEASAGAVTEAWGDGG
ncbi:MAG: hypothetical protein ACK2UY_09815 [Anaerolineae bacterium]|jgi:hypothetical protein